MATPPAKALTGCGLKALSLGRSVVIALFNEFLVVFGKKILARMERVASTISGPIGDVMLWK